MRENERRSDFKIKISRAKRRDKTTWKIRGDEKKRDEETRQDKTLK